MDNLTSAKAQPREQLAKVAGKAQTWIMSVLYIGTFGSFIGYSTAFPLLIKSQFPERASLVTLAFLGPLVGSLIRPGRRLAVGPDGRGSGHARGTSPPWPARCSLVWQGLAQHNFVAVLRGLHAAGRALRASATAPPTG